MRILLLLLVSGAVLAQTRQVGIVLENDLFTSSVNDKYYTNGIEVFYRYLAEKPSDSSVKKINEFRIGQYIFNPQTVKAADPNVHDRPFSGYLFGQFSQSWFRTKESMLKYTVQAGVVGPSSRARQMQEFIHSTFGYKRVRGWEYQIRDAAALQLGAFYSQKLYRGDHIDLNFKANAVAGTVFTGANAGFLTRISLNPLLPIFDSVLYGAALHSGNAPRDSRELFFYLSPGVNYQAYDATIQGSLFNDDSPITYDVMPWRFTGEAGFKYRKGRLDLSYAFVYRTKEVDNRVNEGYFFGSIQAAWLLD